MKKVSLVFILLFATFCHDAFADKPQTMVGFIKFKEKEITSPLYMIGNIQIESTKFTDNIAAIGEIDIKNSILSKVDFQGDINLKKVEFDTGKLSGDIEIKTSTIHKNLKLHGDASLKNVTIADELEAYGPLRIKEADINSLKVISDKVVLDDVTVQNIVYQSNGDNTKKQVLHLIGKSEVTGKITFTSGEGVVVQGEGSLINEVEGAEIVKARRKLF